MKMKDNNMKDNKMKDNNMKDKKMKDNNNDHIIAQCVCSKHRTYGHQKELSFEIQNHWC